MMDGAGGTASLRNAAAHWSLAGDKQLLDLLQNLHERIVTKCQEANTSLDDMVTSLDSASISLQNVNNRLMALSNSQFVESRVYEDDVDVATRDPTVKETPKPSEPTSELSKLRDSLRVLEAYHEPVHIMDSDSESVSDEEEDRMVFKPKDLYADRPLPYIIGSQQWRNKWHAGLVAEESDTDSDTSKANLPSDQYSDSEPDADHRHEDRPHAEQRTISTNSSIGSELTIPTVGKPADIAAELARRLGGNIPHIPEPEPESPPIAAVPTKVYRPQQPATATIFSDEPPPLDAYQSDHSDQPDEPDQPYHSDSEDDVFAELHKKAAPKQTDRSSGVADQLFGNVSNVYGQKSSFDDAVDRNRQAIPKEPSPLFEDPQDSELFSDEAKHVKQPVGANTQPDVSVKKPVGGISLFGNIHGAESIGAAILKRNQRNASISDEEVQEPQEISKVNKHIETDNGGSGPNSKDKLQKNIINDLFSKSNKVKQTNKKVEKTVAVKIEKPVNKKVDLFTDDLFDDIDDIFTNVKPSVKETKQNIKKSLFDDDDDDLFADVAASTSKSNAKLEPKSKSIFESDDDLFSEDNVGNNIAISKYGTKSNEVPLGVGSDCLVNEGNNVNRILPEATETNSNHTATVKSTAVSKREHEYTLTGTNDSETIHKEIKPIPDKSSIKVNQVKSIFDSDSDDDLFSDHKPANDYNTISQKSPKNTIYNVDNMDEPHNVIDEDTVRKVDSSNILHSNTNEIRIDYERDELLGDDSLFEQKAKTVDSNKEFPTLLSINNDAKNNISIDKFEDNNKKADEIFTEIMDVSSEVENNTIIFTENRLLPSISTNEKKIKDKVVPSPLSTDDVQKNQFRSPSLFDEDDDLNDIFAKSFDKNKFEETDKRPKNSSPHQLPEFIIDDDNVNSKLSHVEESSDVDTDVLNRSDEHITSNKKSNLVQSGNESQNINIEKADKQEVKIYEPKVFQNESKDIMYDDNTNLVSNSLEDTEVPLSRDGSTEYSIPIPKVSTLEEKMDNNIEYDSVPEDFVQEEPLISDSQKSVIGEPDIFSDIFSDVPPEFERPKEPKRSKNVNALFDDDSDDEALFFKKNEIVTDDKPEVTFNSQDDRLFHIFHDEPPAMDVDFTQKSKTTIDSDLETPPGEIYSEITVPKTDAYDRTNVKPSFEEETQKESNTFVDSESEKIIDGAKKAIGKLKPMNFNINVSSLLPGASPKKMNTNEQVDGQVISTKNIEDVAKEESKMVKSVSFEGDPESEVLDNTLSKERAKIQVKRRPSSRRARKEAVRKSGIDFGDDSTDNSSSTDISKKDNSIDKTGEMEPGNNTIISEKRSNTSKKENILVDKLDITDVEKVNNNIVVCDDDTNVSNVIIEKEVQSELEEESKLFNNIEGNIADNVKNNVISTSEKKFVQEEGNEINNVTAAFNKRPNVKSKVVYILNDEDIFTDIKPVSNLSGNIQKASENTQNIVKNKVLNIVDDDDELFKSGATKNTNIPTLGNVYKDVNLKNNEIDNFDSDEDIFKASQSKTINNTEHNVKGSKNKNEIDKMEAKIDTLFVKSQNPKKVNKTLFDDLSDDESELFGSKKSVKNISHTDGVRTLIKKENELLKTDVKRSLFGDQSDDDDLFAVKTTKKDLSQSVSKPKEVTTKPTEPVFEDPLSILGQEDDM